MTLVDKILQGDFAGAKELIESTLNGLAAQKLESVKRSVAADIYETVEILDEGNIVKMGRIQKIRRRIRRNSKGRIIVQRNVKRSALKGFRISGNTVRRIPAMQRIQKARKLKRYWKTKGKARMTRTLLKRKMSIRRRKSMGIR